MKEMVYLEWSDSWGVSSSWESEDDLELEPCYIETIGFIVGETLKHISIAGSRNSMPHPVTGSQVCGVMCIPKSQIITRRELRLS